MKATCALAAVTAACLLASCGGGSDGQSPPTMPQPPPEPQPETNLEIHSSSWHFGHNSDLEWYANPQVDLPRNGRYGLRVERPQGGAALARVSFSPSLRNRLEPGWRYDSAARARLEIASSLLWKLGSQAYMQWTRHLNYDPGSLALQVGSQGSLTCHNTHFACYVPSENAVVLSDRMIENVYRALWYSIETNDSEVFEYVHDGLFFVLTHEAGHQFGYRNSHGTRDGCGGSHGCHAPYGSGSVISYDHLEGRSMRYYVTEEDIRHVPNATWNDDGLDEYVVYKVGVPSSLDSWGVWIDHEFEVSGRTAPGSLTGGNLSFIDEISATGLVYGKPSQNVSLTTTATWSGQDNFLGVDMGPDFLGALLRADANLRYTFSASPNLNLRINNFEAHYASGGAATWHDHNFSNWGDFTYDMDCTSGGCSSYSAEAKWYASDAGDPSGWVGGIVDDPAARYVGSFVAKKD